ncbi:MAG: hypothetical protein BGP16_06955 [Sphingobium sp. 66-54]|nr:MAG: hypothetical protein BGP16_06955 [Sphingobium sp. 66-54]
MTERTSAARKRPNKPAVTIRARVGIDEARKTAGKALATTRRKGEALIDDTREKSFRAAAETNRLFYEHPVTAVAAAAAAGAILGIFLPRIALAGKASRIAAQAAKLAIASETAQAVLLGLKDARNSAVKKAAGKAASTVGTRIGTRRRQLDPVDDPSVLNDAETPQRD